MCSLVHMVLVTVHWDEGWDRTSDHHQRPNWPDLAGMAYILNLMIIIPIILSYVGISRRLVRHLVIIVVVYSTLDFETKILDSTIF